MTGDARAEAEALYDLIGRYAPRQGLAAILGAPDPKLAAIEEKHRSDGIAQIRAALSRARREGIEAVLKLRRYDLVYVNIDDIEALLAREEG